MMTKRVLHEILDDQEISFSRKLRVIDREVQGSLRKHISTPSIVIVSGVRRCGKSTLLGQIWGEFGGGKNRITFDDDRLVGFKAEHFQILYEVLLERYGEQRDFFFDEIQSVDGWELFIRRLQDAGKKIWITGSNASLLSRELGTRLTGRHIRIELFPFSFREYADFKGQTIRPEGSAGKAAISKLFSGWIAEGGFPEYVGTREPDYLRALYEGLLYRDILVRYGLSNEKQFREFVWYLAGNTAKKTNFNRIKNLLGFGSATTVSSYFGYLENAYLAFLMTRYDPSAGRQTRSDRKCYFIDNALAVRNGFRPTGDRGRLLENAVFLEFRRSGDAAYYFSGKGECDFVIRNADGATVACQVSESLSEPETRAREFAGLAEACRVLGLKEGTILTLDEEGEDSCQGIRVRILPVWRWLAEDKGAGR